MPAVNYIILPLGEILSNSEYSEQKLIDAFKKFSCNREKDLENFLVHKAIQYENTDYGKTYLCIDLDELHNDNFVIIAYFTIAQKSLDISELSGKKKRKILSGIPGRNTLKSVPAFLIGQLGRCDNCVNNDLPGEELLRQCYSAISKAAKIIGGNLVVLECREHMYGKFYEGQEFRKLYDEVDNEGLYTLYKKVNFKEYWDK